MEYVCLQLDMIAKIMHSRTSEGANFNPRVQVEAIGGSEGENWASTLLCGLRNYICEGGAGGDVQSGGG